MSTDGDGTETVAVDAAPERSITGSKNKKANYHLFNKMKSMLDPPHPS